MPIRSDDGGDWHEPASTLYLTEAELLVFGRNEVAQESRTLMRARACDSCQLSRMRS